MKCLVAGCLFDTVVRVADNDATVAERIALLDLHERREHAQIQLKPVQPLPHMERVQKPKLKLVDGEASEEKCRSWANSRRCHRWGTQLGPTCPPCWGRCLSCSRYFARHF
eukprot:GFUD01137914.1.p1 GENE.GFUD01137914.1~~GFUD01137914.1.p1  ORF type:complete len:111 (-),score=12.44 GFUD01137914.1:34-366(-)